MSWSDLVEEHRAEGIGPHIYEVVRAIVQTTSRRYDPSVYAGAGSWSVDAIDDLLQEFTLHVLLDGGQLTYAMAAGNGTDFRRLLAFQLRRHLAHRRVRTVVDNILERAKPILAEPPFAVVSGSPLAYEVTRDSGSADRAGSSDVGDPPEPIIRRAAVAALAVPRLRVRSGEREPVLYTSENLRRLLVVVGNEIGGPFTLTALDGILRLVLTPFVGSPLIGIDEVAPATQDPGPERTALARMAAERLAVTLTAEQGKILLRKLANEPDQDVAEVLGVSRPTLAKRKKELQELLVAELSGLDDAVATLAIEQLSERLVGS